ncbi:hypothetical protein M9Y10_005315 [Tritrichomonas musculus]|uniref:Protein kinase domain-containing protein n=1 Tax=Tritrichomonas musculus TaxID=1915356 RepID=A0ABR2JLA1_9EUKA
MSELGQYVKREEISRNDCCVKYCAFDKQKGVEVLWYELSIRTPSSMNNDLISKIKTLGNIKHQNIISPFHAWLDKGKHLCYFLTEYFSNQTLSSYVQNIGHNLSRTAIGNWCAQIMDALEVLHSLKPPFVHGNIRCDNIFIDPSNGAIKVGLPDFDVFYSSETRPIQAPEAQKFVCISKNDVWSLGMAVLEMATSKKPFSDVHSDVQLRDKLFSGCLPPEFLEISDPVIADFIQICILPLEQRPSVPQLRDHPLFAEIELNDESGNHSMNNNMLSRGITSDIQKMPEFAALIQKQNQEKRELLHQHEIQQKALREKIRKRNQGLM